MSGEHGDRPLIRHRAAVIAVDPPLPDDREESPPMSIISSMATAAVEPGQEDVVAGVAIPSDVSIQDSRDPSLRGRRHRAAPGTHVPPFNNTDVRIERVVSVHYDQNITETIPLD
jgi:hypothetical protein